MSAPTVAIDLMLPLTGSPSTAVDTASENSTPKDTDSETDTVRGGHGYYGTDVHRRDNQAFWAAQAGK
eukprot:3241299-Alexandrium_andersonii.AAC.1